MLRNIYKIGAFGEKRMRGKIESILICKVCKGSEEIRGKVRFCGSKMVKTIALLLSIILICLVVGCTDSGETEIKDIEIDMDILRPTGSGDSTDNDRNDGNGEGVMWEMPHTGHINFPSCDYAKYVMGIDREAFVGETLTVVGVSFVLDSLARQYMNENPGVTIEITCIIGATGHPDEINELRREIEGEFMTGGGPTLAESFIIDFGNPDIRERLIDWYTIMGADPNFRQEDWLTNVFKAQAMDGHLYAFPREFNFYFTTINTIVTDYKDLWGDREHVTFIELMEMHQGLPLDNPLLFERNFDIQWFLLFSLDNFMDYESGWVDFDNETFIESISYARDITCPESMFGGWQGSDIVRPSEEEEMSGQYFFNIRPASIMHQYLFNFETPLIFGEVTPIVNNDNDLIVIGGEGLVLNANATPIQQALAWDFINFISVSNAPGRTDFFGLPTNIETFYAYLERIVADLMFRLPQYGWRIDCEAAAFEDLVRQLTPIVSMPMAIHAMPAGAFNVFNEALELFHDGEVSAEQTAADIQRQVVQIKEDMGKIQ